MFTRNLLARIESGNAALLARFGITPLHPRTGMAAVGVVNGKPVWPVMGGSEPTSDPAPPADPPTTDPPADPPADPPKDETDWKAESRKWEARSKENAAAKKRLDELEAANQTELEKAQKAADDAAQRAQAATHRAVRSEIRALADGFEDREDAVLNLGDLTRFVADDGEVDEKAIGKELAAVLERKPHLAKKDPQPADPSPGQPARPTERLRPGAAPAEPVRAGNLYDAVGAWAQSQT